MFFFWLWSVWRREPRFQPTPNKPTPNTLCIIFPWLQLTFIPIFSCSKLLNFLLIINHMNLCKHLEHGRTYINKHIIFKCFILISFHLEYFGVWKNISASCLFPSRVTIVMEIECVWYNYTHLPWWMAIYRRSKYGRKIWRQKKYRTNFLPLSQLLRSICIF